LERYFGALEGYAHFGPYRVDDDSVKNSLKNLKDIVRVFHNWPRNKLFELRELLYGKKEEAVMFAEEMKAKGFVLPEIEGCPYHRKIWIDEKTPYFDAIEILEFYPKRLLEGA